MSTPRPRLEPRDRARRRRRRGGGGAAVGLRSAVADVSVRLAVAQQQHGARVGAEDPEQRLAHAVRQLHLSCEGRISLCTAVHIASSLQRLVEERVVLQAVLRARVQPHRTARVALLRARQPTCVNVRLVASFPTNGRPGYRLTARDMNNFRRLNETFYVRSCGFRSVSLI